MSLTDLKNTLEGSRTESGAILITEATLNAAEVTRLLSTFPGNQLIFNDPAVAPPNGSLELTGKIALPGLGDLQTAMTFTEVEGGLGVQLDAGFPQTAVIALPGVSWFSINNMGLTLLIENPGAGVTGGVRGTINLGDTALPVVVRFPVGPNQWFVEGFFEDVPIPSLADLASLVGGADLANALPDELKGGAGFAIANIQAMFNPVAKTLNYASITIKSTEPWEIVDDKFSVGDVLLTFHIAHPTDSARREMGIKVEGVLNVVDTDVAVTVTGPDTDGEWSLTVAPNLQIPTVGELVAMVSDASMANSLPEPLRTIGGINVENLELRFVPRTKTLTYAAFAVSTAQPWEIVPGKVSVHDLAFSLDALYPLSSAQRSVDGSAGGVITLGSVDVHLAVDFGEETVLTGNIPEISLSAILRDLGGDDIALPHELPDLVLADVDISFTPGTGAFSFSAQSPTVWNLPIGISGISISGISFSLNRTVNGDGTKSTSGTVAGTFNIGSASISAVYNFPGDFVLTADVPTFSLSPLLQDLCGGDTVRSLPVPTSVLNFEITDIQVLVAPQAKTFAVSATCVIGQFELLVKRTTTGWGFAAGFAPPSTFKFSDLSSELVVLDDLRFDGTVLVISTSADRDFELSTIKLPDDDAQVRVGLNFFAALDAQGTGVYELTGLKTLNVYAAIGTRVTDMVIEAEISGDFEIAENVIFSEVKFRLQPAPSNFSLSLLGVILARLDNSDLRFVGAMSIQVVPTLAASFAATMEGVWNEPFGTKGLAIANVALEVGVLLSSFPPLPSLGFAGSLKIGDFEGMVAVKFDTANPSRSMLAVAFNKLYLMDIMRAFCGPDVVAAIPQSISSTVLNIGFEGRTPDEKGVNVYIVPQPTTIGELSFEQGFTVQGRLIFWGLSAYGYLNIDYMTGTVLYAEVDPIDLGGVFKLTGANGEGKARLSLDLRKGKTPLVEISCGVELLGMRRDTFLKINDEGFEFMISSKIFDLFECTLIAKGVTLGDTSGIYVAVTMKNDLLEYLREKATYYIQVAADAATSSLTSAQRDVDAAQSEVNRLNNAIADMRRTIQGERDRDAQRLRDAQAAVNNAQNEVNRINTSIADMRRTIQGERDRDTQRLRDAQAAVNNAQNEVNRINTSIADMRRTIQGERDRDTQRLRDAQAAVNNAQNEVNRIQNEINNAHNTINYHKQKMAEKQRWYDNSPWYKKSYRWAELSAELSWRGAAVAGLYTAIGGMETAKATAYGVLEGAKQVLRGIEAGAKTFPIDADPRMVGLFTALGTATGALQAARLTLTGIEAAIKTFPIDADPRMVGLFTALGTATGALQTARLTLTGIEAAIKTFPIDADPRIVGLFTALGTATGALQAANLVLEGAKQTVGGMADVAQFIVDAGLGGILDVRAASFEAALSAAHGGAVAMSITLSFMKQAPQTYSLDFSFHNPLSAAEALAKQLLPG
jgi:peptidoglycan hydrolase CwlO-like protein